MPKRKRPPARPRARRTARPSVPPPDLRGLPPNESTPEAPGDTPNETRSVMGRPRKPINWALFDALVAMKCTLIELAAEFQCSDDTIERAVQREHGVTFAEYWSRKAPRGNVSIRRRQMEVALGNPTLGIPPNVTMLIWLGKQYLGQSDKAEVVAPATGVDEHSVPLTEGERAEVAARLLDRAEERRKKLTLLA